MTRPENAEKTTVQDASPDPVVGTEAADQHGSVRNGVASAPPQQRQRPAPGDGDPKTVALQVGAPEHARPTKTFNHGGPPEVSPSTVRVGGYTRPERVLPAAVPSAGMSGSGVSGAGAPGVGVSGTPSRSVRVPRRTSLQLQHLDPWSVLKLSLVLSVAGFLVWLVAVGVLYGVLAGMGVWDQINGTYSDLTSLNNPQASTQLISGGRVFGVAFVIGLVNIVLLTALATVGSLVYNIAADFVGGVEVTLSEPD